MFAGILCSSFNIASWQAFIQSAGIKNVQTRNNYILNKDKYLSWNNNSNISNILHLHLTWSHDSCPNPPVDVCTCAGHYNSFYSKICWLYGPASLFFPGRWNTNTRKWLPKLKINKFFWSFIFLASKRCRSWQQKFPPQLPYHNGERRNTRVPAFKTRWRSAVLTFQAAGLPEHEHH